MLDIKVNDWNMKSNILCLNVNRFKSKKIKITHKMLDLCKILLEKLCLWPLETTTSMHVTAIFCYFYKLFTEAILLVGTFKYAFQYIDDIYEATEPAFAGFAFATSMFIYIWMISKKKPINKTIGQLEIYVNESKH